MAKISTDRITDENVDDIMATAAYGGITYWATDPSAEDFVSRQDATAHVIKEEETGKVFYLSLAKIRQAVVEIANGRHTGPRIQGYILAAFNNWTAEDGIDCGDIDADAADCIVQVACFGEVVYG